MTSAGKTYRTETGHELSDADIEAIAQQVEGKTYDVAELKERRRLSMGSSTLADVVPVRLEPEVREAISARAEEEKTTTSEIIRRALRSFLDVA